MSNFLQRLGRLRLLHGQAHLKVQRGEPCFHDARGVEGSKFKLVTARHVNRASDHESQIMLIVLASLASHFAHYSVITRLFAPQVLEEAVIDEDCFKSHLLLLYVFEERLTEVVHGLVLP